MINIKELPSWSDSKLKAHAFILVGHGAMPLEQWAGVFSHKDFHPWPELRCKALTVWFPTMVDFLKSESDIEAIAKESVQRKMDLLELTQIAATLADHFRKVLEEFDRDEQLFLNDRRLQNVHGRLSTFILEEHKVSWFNKVSQRVEKTNLSSNEFHRTLLRFYKNMQQSEMILLNRLLASQSFKDLSELYKAQLRFEDRLIPLAKKLGVLGNGDKA